MLRGDSAFGTKKVITTCVAEGSFFYKQPSHITSHLMHIPIHIIYHPNTCLPITAFPSNPYILLSASKPKTKEGRGAQGAPSTTLRATFGTHPAESQAADASPARDIAAVINPQATADAAMILRITTWGAVRAVPVLRPIPTPLSAELALGRRRIKRGRVETSWWAHRRTGWRGAQRPAMPCRRPWMPAILERHYVSCAGGPKLLYRAGADPNPRGQT